MKKSSRYAATLAAAVLSVAGVSATQAAWEPTRPVEFIVPAGTGGGADQMARVIQGIVTKHKLMNQSMVVINKAGGAGGEGFLDVKVARQSTQANDHTVEPVHHAARHRHSVQLEGHDPGRHDGARRVRAVGERRDAIQDARQDYIAAVKAAPPGQFKMGGTGSKQEDQIITVAIEKRSAASSPTCPTKAAARSPCSSSATTSIPPSTIRSRRWRSGAPARCGRSACSTQAAALHRQDRRRQAWADIPTCKSQGLDVEYLMLRGIFMPPGVSRSRSPIMSSC